LTILKSQTNVAVDQSVPYVYLVTNVLVRGCFSSRCKDEQQIIFPVMLFFWFRRPVKYLKQK